MLTINVTGQWPRRHQQWWLCAWAIDVVEETEAALEDSKKMAPAAKRRRPERCPTNVPIDGQQARPKPKHTFDSFPVSHSAVARKLKHHNTSLSRS